MRIVVFGGGMQGRVIAQNLLARPEKPEVLIADLRQPPVVPTGAKFAKCDVLDAKQVAELVKGADATVLAVPSQIAHAALANLCATGVAVADVSFTPDPPLSLDGAAKKSGSCCVVDVGVAPGLSHILVALAHTELKGLDKATILVGGIPQEPPSTFRHAIYFNPHDLLAEYIRPARARKHGMFIEPAPLDVPLEVYHDSELGHLEAFLSDGLRSLLDSFPDIPEMAELTLRWPGHVQTMANLRDMGMFNEQVTVAAIADALGKRYPAEKYPDVLLMVVEGSKGNESRAWRLIDRRTKDESAMSRTTGYTTAAVAMVLARKEFAEPGVHAPERLGKDPKIAKAIVADLAERGVKVESLPQPHLAKA
ncbi:MAG TPA: saccharopine dehydrogenase C-terminal domain-containing protein [Candidatus Obscuribacterales bacterium]